MGGILYSLGGYSVLCKGSLLFSYNVFKYVPFLHVSVIPLHFNSLISIYIFFSERSYFSKPNFPSKMRLIDIISRRILVLEVSNIIIITTSSSLLSLSVLHAECHGTQVAIRQLVELVLSFQLDVDSRDRTKIAKLD